ncbi:peptidoglycan-binding domain-containing protein [Methylobacterium goesingense]
MRRLQERLRQAGYYRGPIDGKGGAKMETALRKWRSVGILDMK